MNGEHWSTATTESEPLSIVRLTEGEVEILECSGELDLATGPALRSSVQSALSLRPTHVVIDLCGVSFVDSSGLGVLLQAVQSANEAGVQLRLVCEVPSTLRLLELTGADSVLTVYPTRGRAVKGSVAKLCEAQAADEPYARGAPS